MAGRTVTPGLVRHRAFEAKVGRQYLTRTGRLARLAKIEPDASGDDMLHFEYLDPPARCRRPGADEDPQGWLPDARARGLAPDGSR